MTVVNIILFCTVQIHDFLYQTYTKCMKYTHPLNILCCFAIVCLPAFYIHLYIHTHMHTLCIVTLLNYFLGTYYINICTNNF